MTLQHYKDGSNNLYAIEPEHAHVLPASCVPITDIEAEEIRRISAESAQANPVVSAWKIRRALNLLSLRQLVEYAVASSDQDTKDAWEYATEFERNHPLVVGLGASLGKTSEELDAIFTLAATI